MRTDEVHVHRIVVEDDLSLDLRRFQLIERTDFNDVGSDPLRRCGDAATECSEDNLLVAVGDQSRIFNTANPMRHHDLFARDGNAPLLESADCPTYRCSRAWRSAEPLADVIGQIFERVVRLSRRGFPLDDVVSSLAVRSSRRQRECHSERSEETVWSGGAIDAPLTHTDPSLPLGMTHQWYFFGFLSNSPLHCSEQK